MKRSTFNFLWDCMAALALLGLIATGIVIRFALPPGSGRTRFLWGWTRHQWGDAHFWLAVATVIIIVVHVAIHWTWVVSVIASNRGGGEPHAPSRSSRLLAGIAVLAVLSGLVLGFWQVTTRHVTYPKESTVGAKRAVEGGARVHVQGSMTLGEVSRITGVPVQTIRDRLGLPSSVGQSEKLGQLSHEYGFTMAQARQRLAEFQTATTPASVTGRE